MENIVVLPCYPLSTFTGWLEIENKLTTRERLAQWGYTAYTSGCLCVFCRDYIESRDHIFLEFSFAKRIWETVIGYCLVSEA